MATIQLPLTTPARLLDRLESLRLDLRVQNHFEEVTGASTAAIRKVTTDQVFDIYNHAQRYRDVHPDCPPLPFIPEMLTCNERAAVEALKDWCRAVIETRTRREEPVHPLVAVEERKAAQDHEWIDSSQLEALTGMSRTTRKSRVRDGLIGARQGKSRGSHEYAWLHGEHRAMTREEIIARFGPHGVNQGPRGSAKVKAT